MRTMAVHTNLTSAAGVLSLLDESELEVKVFALQKLNELVDAFWAEIADHVSKFEVLYEDEGFPEKELSALVASKVYYHLGSFKDSLMFALGAGQRFDVNGTTEYIETILSKCIDHYTQLRIKQFDGTLEDGEAIDVRLEAIVDRMFDRCLHDQRYKQAIGIAFETRRIDILQRAIHESRDIPGMLAYSLKVTLSLISSPGFRNTVLQVLVRTYLELETPDYISVCQCYIFLDEPQKTAQVLERLVRDSKALTGSLQDNLIVAYQIAFDLYECASQHFLRRVQQAISALLPSSPPPSPIFEDDGVTTTPLQETGGAAAEEDKMEANGEEGGKKEGQEGGGGGGEEGGGGGGEGGGGELKKSVEDEARAPLEELEVMEVEIPTSHDSVAAPAGHVMLHDPKEEEKEEEWMESLRSITTVLGGTLTVSLHQDFLIRNNHTDLQILKNTKDASRGSICHNATIISNGLMHYGTTSDTLLRENLEWLKKASNWAKFTATASLGLIHWGHEKEALNLMASYLPKDSANNSPYAEGGGLYAIGLIHANHGMAVIEYLGNEVKNNNSEIVRHGGCLGLGLAAMGTANLEIYELLKENLLTRDDAIIGEAAGLAMGLVMIGTASPIALEDMINYARDTQHEKIQRGLAVGIALVMYGRMEDAETLIEDLCRDKDPLLRRSGMFTVAMAYCGSGDNKAIRRLLHVAVSDVDNNVRRAAVTALGFLLFRTPEQCPHVVSLLSESFNSHVRCGSAMALGISCAGTGNKEALSIIEPMLSDSVPFVQQAAQIAAAMILIQQTEAMTSKAATFRQHFAKIIADKLEDNLTKFGAIVAQGIIDAGGRNVTISLQSRAGHMSMRTAVGILVFCQFWFWFPFCHFLSLSFTPASLITLNADLKMPKIQFRSKARPSLYAYPAPLEGEKKKERAKVETAVLSVTAKAKARKTAAEGETMEVDKKDANAKTDKKMDTSSSHSPPSSEVAVATGGGGGKGVEEGKEKKSVTFGGGPDTPVEGAEKAGEKEEEEKKEEEMELDEAEGEEATNKKGSEEKGKEAKDAKVEGKEEGGGRGPEEKKKEEPEADFEMLSNPTRVLQQQLKVLSWDESSRYQPLKPISVGGIIMLRNTDRDNPEDLLEPLTVTVPGQEEEGPEPPPPEPFEWTEDM